MGRWGQRGESLAGKELRGDQITPCSALKGSTSRLGKVDEATLEL